MARRQIAQSRILITGASQGIGRALATAAVRRGGRVLAVARSHDLLAELASELRGGPGSLDVLDADIISAADRQRMVEAARERLGGLDILINNAGIGATGHFYDVGAERLRTIMEVNFFALAEIIRLFIPMLRQGKTPAIVNISSIAAKRGIPARSEYSASKFAVEGLSQALRAEIAKDGIDVLLVCPGLTQSNFSKNMLEQKAKMQLDHMRGMTAEQVADAALAATEKGTREIVLTFQGKLMAFVNRFLPKLADRIANRNVRGLFKEEIAERKRRRATSS